MPKPQAGTVPLKVWVLLNNGTDVYEDEGNVGCRLNLAEITSYVDALKVNGAIYGTPQPFVWDGTVTEVHSIHIPLCPIGECDRRTDVDELYTDVIVIQEEWEQNALNVYFSGWASTNPNSGDMEPGMTFDPRDAYEHQGAIFINDRGWNDEFGVEVILPDHVFEHEVAHFLLSRRNIGPYDGTEHVPDGSQNILDLFVPHPLLVPDGEKQEASQRILNGTWNR